MFVVAAAVGHVVIYASVMINRGVKTFLPQNKGGINAFF